MTPSPTTSLTHATIFRLTLASPAPTFIRGQVVMICWIDVGYKLMSRENLFFVKTSNRTNNIVTVVIIVIILIIVTPKPFPLDIVT